MKAKKKQYKIAVGDAETDPFKYGRKPRPFVWGFYDGERFLYFWGENATRDFYNFLLTLEDEYIIYMHNGGKFDFHFFIEEEVLENPIKIINGRIAKAKIGQHELRDSFSILPIPLAAYQKDKIDYVKMEKENREKNKPEIINYLRGDCVYLFNLVSDFINRFGLKLTIASTAIKELEKLHPFETFDDSHDSRFRPFYFGGRVECFEKGLIKGDFKIYDVNSMYPFVMSEYLHPLGMFYRTDENELEELPENYPYFIITEGYSHGAFPLKDDKKKSLHFPHGYGRFTITGHEHRAAKRLGLYEENRIVEVYVPKRTINFKDFVSKFIKEKIEGQETDDKTKTIFAKLMLNSAYGKFASNPETYKDYFIRYPGDKRPRILLDDETREENPSAYELASFDGEFELYERPSSFIQYYDVAIAASITGAARSVLMEAIAKSKRVIYCDTDSVICESFSGEVHKTKLGAWDFEKEGDEIAIAGKKMYCLFKNGEEVKKATKGARLNADEIRLAALGHEINWKNTAPTFHLGKKHTFITRKICAT